jgi:hypothetical protein
MPVESWILVLLGLVLVSGVVGLLLVRARGAAIPVGDTGALRRQVRRTTLVRIGGAAAAIALLATAMATVPQPRGAHPAARGPLPATVVVLDMSTSIGSGAYPVIAKALDTIAATGGARRVGLVAFSDTAYTALPPTVAPAQLEPFARYYRKTQGHYPRNPWSQNFSGGTLISSALALARDAIHQARLPHAVVVLLSDLADLPSDYPAFQAEVAAYSRDPIVTLRVVPLPPSSRTDWARGVLGPATVVGPARPGVVAVAAPGGRGRDYLLVVVAAALALGTNELLCAKLGWRGRVEVAGRAVEAT